MAKRLLFGHRFFPPRPDCLKLMTSLVSEALKFNCNIRKMLPFFAEKNVRSFCNAKAPHNISSKNIAAVEFVSTVRLNKSKPQLTKTNNVVS